MKDYKDIDKCLLCDCKMDRTQVLNLGNTPLANDFSDYPGDLIQDDIFPLKFQQCFNCRNFQSLGIVNPERLFRDYIYESGTSPSTHRYAEEYAKSVKNKLFHANKKINVLDIGSNDGTYLTYFKEMGAEVQGIDPARDAVNKANNNYIPTHEGFFNQECARHLTEDYNYRLFNIIISNNTFAHIEDLTEIVKGIKISLTSDGIFVFENSYLLDMLDKNLWDILYHEHIFTHSLYPLIKFMNSFGMKVFDVERTSNQGGSIRVFCARKNSLYKVSENVSKLLEEEKNILERVSKFISNFQENIRVMNEELNKLSGNIDIYGFPAKTTTLLYALNKNPNITKQKFRFAYDDAKLKIGKYSPGMHIPILHPDELLKNNPDYLFIGAWNFAESIIQKCKQNGYKGKFIVPLPECKII